MSTVTRERFRTAVSESDESSSAHCNSTTGNSFSSANVRARLGCKSLKVTWSFICCLQSIDTMSPERNKPGCKQLRDSR